MSARQLCCNRTLPGEVSYTFAKKSLVYPQIHSVSTIERYIFYTSCSGYSRCLHFTLLQPHTSKRGIIYIRNKAMSTSTKALYICRRALYSIHPEVAILGVRTLLQQGVTLLQPHIPHRTSPQRGVIYIRKRALSTSTEEPQVYLQESHRNIRRRALNTSTKSPLYIRRRALSTSAEEPQVYLQKSPRYIHSRTLNTSTVEPCGCIYINRRALSTSTKEPCVYPQKSPVYPQKSPVYHSVTTEHPLERYGVATVSRIDKIRGLFCRILSLL